MTVKDYINDISKISYGEIYVCGAFTDLCKGFACVDDLKKDSISQMDIYESPEQDFITIKTDKDFDVVITFIVDDSKARLKKLNDIILECQTEISALLRNFNY